MNVDLKTLFVEERATFEKHRKAWVRKGLSGRWTVIRGDEFLGDYESSGAAWRAGIAHYGKPGFMIKQVWADDRLPFPRRPGRTKAGRRS